MTDFEERLSDHWKTIVEFGKKIAELEQKWKHLDECFVDNTTDIRELEKKFGDYHLELFPEWQNELSELKNSYVEIEAYSEANKIHIEELKERVEGIYRSIHGISEPSVLDTMEEKLAEAIPDELMERIMSIKAEPMDKEALKEALEPHREYVPKGQTESIEDGIIKAFNTSNETEYKLVAKEDLQFLIEMAKFWSGDGICSIDYTSENIKRLEDIKNILSEERAK